jgi:hypothetical protein
MNWKIWTWKLKKDKITKTITLQTDEYIFPCKDCLILPSGCRQLCDKVEMNEAKFRADAQRANTNQESLTCPDCGGQMWYEGPSGGMSQNIRCGKCKHWFNFGGPFGFTERIHVGENGRVYD